MGFWEELGKGTAGAMFTGLGQLLKDIRTALTGQTPLDATKQAELLAQIAAMEAAAGQRAAEFDAMVASGQIDVAKLDAASPDKYQSRWRPTVGWVCCAGLAYVFLIRPLFPWVVQVAGIIIAGWFPEHVRVVAIPPLPDIPVEDMTVLLLGMLGLGGMRSFEKVRGAR